MSTIERPAHVELAVTGMTCAACANRIEKKLNRVDGVNASVNYATEQASVDFDPAVVAPEDLIEVVRKMGYDAALPAPAAPVEDVAVLGEAREERRTEAEEAADRHVADLRQRLIVSTVLSVPVIAMAMISALQFRNWQWASLALASPVAVWGGWPSTGPPSRTRGWARPRWTPSCRSACPLRTSGRSGRCSSATPARPA